MSAPPIYLEPLDGTEMIRVLKNGRLYLAPVTAVLDLRTAVALTALTARLDALEAALAAEGKTRTAADTAAAGALAGEVSARQSADAGLSARTGALEAKPEEVVPFSGTIITGTLAIGTKTFTVTGLAGLKAGERILVEPASAWPAGLVFAGAWVPADGTAEITLAALVALTASKTIPLAITALR